MEVEDEVQLADVAEEVVQDLDKQMYALQIRQLIVGHVDAHREEQTRIPPVDHLVRPKLCRRNEKLSDRRWD